LKKNLYLIEFYVKDPATGWLSDINFAWVYARCRDSALLKLILNQTDRFDEVILIEEQVEIVPLAGDFTEGVNLFIIGSPEVEMTDEEFVEDMRTFRIDHLPDGYPAVQTWQIDRLIEIIDKQREQSALVPQWNPIETAPKDKKILLYYPNQLFNGINVIIGRWDEDTYSKNPTPYWSNDLSRLSGISATKKNQPTHWMPTPEFTLEVL